MTSEASELYRAGRLADAVAALTATVKARPADTDSRGLLAELLCVAGEGERADRQLDALGRQEPGLAVSLALIRQLLRAQAARDEVFGQGRVPEFLEPPGPVLRGHLMALVHLRAGEPGAALERLAEAAAATPPVQGTCDGRPFAGLRDLDDLTAPFFEVLTATGKYYWVPMEAVRRIGFRAPQRPRDLCWRPARMTVRNGPDGEVYIPAIYPATPPGHEAARLGRVTEWTDAPGAPVRGIGQRTLLVGEEEVPLLSLNTLDLGDGP